MLAKETAYWLFAAVGSGNGGCAAACCGGSAGEGGCLLHMLRWLRAAVWVQAQAKLLRAAVGVGDGGWAACCGAGAGGVGWAAACCGERRREKLRWHMLRWGPRRRRQGCSCYGWCRRRRLCCVQPPLAKEAAPCAAACCGGCRRRKQRCCMLLLRWTKEAAVRVVKGDKERTAACLW